MLQEISAESLLHKLSPIHASDAQLLRHFFPINFAPKSAHPPYQASGYIVYCSIV